MLVPPDTYFSTYRVGPIWEFCNFFRALVMCCWPVAWDVNATFLLYLCVLSLPVTELMWALWFKYKDYLHTQLYQSYYWFITIVKHFLSLILDWPWLSWWPWVPSQYYSTIIWLLIPMVLNTFWHYSYATFFAWIDIHRHHMHLEPILSLSCQKDTAHFCFGSSWMKIHLNGI